MSAKERSKQKINLDLIYLVQLVLGTKINFFNFSAWYADVQNGLN